MNLNSRKFCRLNIKPFLIEVSCLLRLLLLGRRSSVCTYISTICFFGCLACVRAFVCFALVSLNISLPFSQLLLLVQGTAVSYFKLLLKFRNVLKHTKSRSSFACNQNIKEDIPTAFEVLLCFENKRKDINKSSTKTSTQRASNILG